MRGFIRMSKPVLTLKISVFLALLVIFNCSLSGFCDSRELKSEHFIINYDDSVQYSYAPGVKKTAERLYRLITQEFNLIRDKLWVWDNRAEIFIASGREDYLSRYGCSPWSTACVNYRQKVIYTYPDQSDFEPILAHELTHIIFREYLGRNNLPLWLDEGMAVYIEDKYRNGLYRKNLFILKDLIKEDGYIDFRHLNEITSSGLGGQPTDYAKIFYIQSYSIIYFIFQEYGKSNFSRFLWHLKNDKDVQSALSRTYYYLTDLEALEKRWKEFYLE
ncbi:MAG: hypothetical protein GF375_06035 [Candidatus Omnitrophica bacterium]|nr:hypothetical protein [Candidatus Omnitrophota bacterium]MBD3269535.1 hypothetical protein [Candidatus Omnitrophota bacterium]